MADAPEDPALRARDKYACPACGAEARWTPSRGALVCEFCGTVSPTTLPEDGGEVVEHDLVAALRRLRADQRGWAAERRSVRCGSCQAISVLDPARVAQRCDFCGSTQVVAYEAIGAPIRPESVLPFTVAESVVRERMRDWYGSHWFAPGNLAAKALTDTVRGIYLPYWTFDAHAEADWTAEAGHYYYTTERRRNAQGEMETYRERHTRWVPASGHLERSFDDELVPASKGVHAPLLQGIQPFPTGKLVPYDAGYVSGWVVEQYRIDLVAAAAAARKAMERAVEAACASAVPGDTHRNLSVDVRFADQTFKHVLFPIWILTYTYGSRSFQVVANGATGTVHGEYPLSPWKVLIAAVLGMALAAGALALYARVEGWW